MFCRGLLVCLVLFCGWLFSLPAYSQDEELQRKINRAIEKGVTNLKRSGGDAGSWFGAYPPGATALAAWSLLESGVKESDVQIQKAAASIRRECLTMSKTYPLALSILFLDRLSDPGDEVLIQALGARLLGGQNTIGSWGYDCPVADQEDRAWLEQQIGEADKNRGEKTNGVKKKTVFPQIEKQIDKFKSKPWNAFPDNSNTQFAMLALWVARRHGLPVDDSLKFVTDYFRKTQLPGGGWYYRAIDPYPRATMTCAGLLGLALGEGIKPKKAGQGDQLKKDPKVQRALELLGKYLKNPGSDANKNLLEKPGMFNYLLFSLERMAVVYDLKTIGERDWYLWGAQILVDKQSPDGSWPGLYGPADTCFALLFLHRANVAEDLTNLLQGITKPPKKKLKKSEREADPFDLPPDKEKKKIKIRPKDKQTGLLPQSLVPQPLVSRLSFDGNAVRETPFREWILFPTWERTAQPIRSFEACVLRPELMNHP
jgi:hypothetical protein